MYKTPVEIIYERVDRVVKDAQEILDDHIMKEILRVGVVVDKDELIRAMHYDRRQYEKGYQDGKDAAIAEYKSRYIEPTRWIPVTERLPEKNGNYIVTACDEGCSYGEGIWYSTVVVVAEYYNGAWTWYEGSTEYDLQGIVTHWMQLPTPPKEEI